MCRFLLPILQLRSILNEPTLGDMEDALKSLPHNLPEAFEETVTRIQRLPENRSRLGMNALMWVCHAKRPLAILELSEALSVREGQTTLSQMHRPSSKMILECCQGLLILDSENMLIRFAHYSIQEYLVSRSKYLFPCAERDTAAICLRYLLFETFKDGPSSEEDVIESRVKQNPFLSYASRYWGMHAKQSETDTLIQDLIFMMLVSRNKLAGAHQVMQYEMGYRDEYWEPEECFSSQWSNRRLAVPVAFNSWSVLTVESGIDTALHHASHHGLENTVQSILDRGSIDINAYTELGTTPLVKAASAGPTGHLRIVRMLLDRGADPYLSNWYGNALHCAAEAGCADVIRLLISYGMDPNSSEDGDKRFPLECTLDNDHSDAFKTLVDLGADMKIVNESGNSLLHRAVLDGCVNIVDLVLQQGWVEVNEKNGSGFTAIHFAVMHGHIRIISQLINAGANINAEDHRGRTPLDWAYWYNDKDIVALLLDQGARGARKHYILGPPSAAS